MAENSEVVMSMVERIEELLREQYPEVPFPDILAKRIGHLLPPDDPTAALAAQQRRIDGQIHELERRGRKLAERNQEIARLRALLDGEGYPVASMTAPTEAETQQARVALIVGLLWPILQRGWCQWRTR